MYPIFPLLNLLYYFFFTNSRGFCFLSKKLSSQTKSVFEKSKKFPIALIRKSSDNIMITVQCFLKGIDSLKNL